MLKNILFKLFTIVICALITFFVLRMNPINPVQQLANSYITGMGYTPAMAHARAVAELNYDPDEPITKQFTRYFGGLITGNMGISQQFKMPVSTIIVNALPWTLLVMLLSMGLSTSVGISIGMKIAYSKRKWPTTLLNIYTSVFGAIPDYIVAYLLLGFLAVRFHLFPIIGAYDINVTPGLNFPFIINVLYHACLPVATFFITQVAHWTLNMRASAINMIGTDFTSCAQARGLSARRISSKYVGRNAMIPMVIQIVISFTAMFTGISLIEIAFAYQGIGYYFGAATGAQDFPLEQGLFLMIALSLVFFSFIADLINMALDPRVKEMMRKKAGTQKPKKAGASA